jgi:hypothetical protein
MVVDHEIYDYKLSLIFDFKYTGGILTHLKYANESILKYVWPISLPKISFRRLDLSFLHFIVDFVSDIEVLRRQIHHLRHSIHRAVVRIQLTELNTPRLVPVHQLEHCFHLLAAERSIQFP